MDKVIKYRIVEYMGNSPREVDDSIRGLYKVQIKRWWGWESLTHVIGGGMDGNFYGIRYFLSTLEARQYIFDKLTSYYSKLQIKLIEYPSIKIGIYRDDKSPQRVHDIKELLEKKKSNE